MIKTAFLMSRYDKTDGINKAIADEDSDDFQLNYAILDPIGQMIGAVTLNVYKDYPTKRNESGQLLYHWDDEHGSDYNNLCLVLDDYKQSVFWERYPLVL